MRPNQTSLNTSLSSAMLLLLLLPGAHKERKLQSQIPESRGGQLPAVKQHRRADKLASEKLSEVDEVLNVCTSESSFLVTERLMCNYFDLGQSHEVGPLKCIQIN